MNTLRRFDADAVAELRRWSEYRGTRDEFLRGVGRGFEADPPTLYDLRGLWPDLWRDEDNEDRFIAVTGRGCAGGRSRQWWGHHVLRRWSLPARPFLYLASAKLAERVGDPHMALDLAGIEQRLAEIRAG